MSEVKDIRSFVVDALMKEDSWKPKYNKYMAQTYEQATKEEKEKIDIMFTHLCGWTVESILKDSEVDQEYIVDYPSFEEYKIKIDKYMVENYGIEYTEHYSETELKCIYNDNKDFVGEAEAYAEKHDLTHKNNFTQCSNIKLKDKYEI